MERARPDPQGAAFGLTNSEGNHGEDVKEYYFYLDSTPTHSYMKYLYKYPQAAYPYDDLVADQPQPRQARAGVRAARHRRVRRRPLLRRLRRVRQGRARRHAGPDHASPTAARRRPPLHLLPTLWFRNTWSWPGGGSKPVLERIDGRRHAASVRARHTDPLFQESLGDYYLYGDGDVPLLFTENETNNERLFGGANATPYVKDGFHDYVVHGERTRSTRRSRAPRPPRTTG